MKSVWAEQQEARRLSVETAFQIMDGRFNREDSLKQGTLFSLSDVYERVSNQ